MPETGTFSNWELLLNSSSAFIFVPVFLPNGFMERPSVDRAAAPHSGLKPIYQNLLKLSFTHKFKHISIFKTY